MARRPPNITDEAVRAQCRANGLVLPEEATMPFTTYMQLLPQWNAVMNLVGTRRWHDTLALLVADSFHLDGFLRTLPLPDAPQTWDLGAGAGLPGLPLRMLWQAGDYHMVEAREKRALFLSTVLARTPLPRTTVFRGRAEDFFVHASQPADLVVSRAFLPWQEVLELVRPHLVRDEKSPGRVVFLMRERLPAKLPPAIACLWRAEAEHSYKIGEDTRYFWCLQVQG